mgnify:CR=1 FL=1|tara:strand:- start:20 stop:529 length:510 start_codon:yes stop_codon:yes gene_type:complete
MNFIKISLGILLTLSLSRFIPHPPNFTSLLALSFYIPVLLGISYLPILVLSFIITDLFIGFHGFALFTWGSVIFIGLVSKFFSKNIFTRISGSLFGAFIFFVITNFGVWTSGIYSYNINGLIQCYLLALPFFAYTLISTFIFSSVIETFYKMKFIKNFFTNNFTKYKKI